MVIGKSNIRDILFADSINGICKRGQFFLLAAVIISAVIISLGVGTNRVVVNDEPGSFYDFSYEVKREVGAVLDYGVYSGFDGSVNLTEFVEMLAMEIEERSPGSDFIFIYGNSTKMEVKNYGSESVYTDGVEVKGLREGVQSLICMEQLCQEINEDVTNFEAIPAPLRILDATKAGSNNITVNIEGNEFGFPLSDYMQVIFIMQKEVDGDRHIIVE